MTGPDDDQSLIDACRLGRTEAFGELVRRYQDRLYPTVFRLCGSTEDALDLLQDAFLRAFEKLGSFHGESSFYTWVYRIAVNLALSDRRKHRHVHVGPLARGETSLDPPGDPEATDPGRPLELRERDDAVRAALAALADDHRAVVILKEYDGLRYEEIAATLGVPIGTVRSRLHRARLELRDRLQGVVEAGVAVGAGAVPAARPTAHAPPSPPRDLALDGRSSVP